MAPTRHLFKMASLAVTWMLSLNFCRALALNIGLPHPDFISQPWRKIGELLRNFSPRPFLAEILSHSCGEKSGSYLAAVEKNWGCEIKSQGRPGFEASHAQYIYKACLVLLTQGIQ